MLSVVEGSACSLVVNSTGVYGGSGSLRVALDTACRVERSGPIMEECFIEGYPAVVDNMLRDLLLPPVASGREDD